MWNASWWLTKKELSFQWSTLLTTALATLIIAILTLATLEQHAVVSSAEQSAYMTHLLLDLIFVGITPSFAVLFMSGPYLSFRTIREDPFTKQMALYRSWSIPIRVLATSRIMMALATLLMMSIIFYVIIYFNLSDSFYSLIPRENFTVFMFVWFGYALFLSGMMKYIEYGLSGKTLYLISFVTFGLIALTSCVLIIVTDKGIVDRSLELIHHTGWYASCIALLCGIVGCILWNKLLVNRLLKRDYL